MSITPDQFLAQPSDPDDDAGDKGPQPFSTDWATGRVWYVPPPHELLAPLERIANALEGQGSAAVEEDRLREAFSDRNQEFDDLEAKYESLFGLVADIEKLVSKSTSKLANSVRDAINGWKTGTVIDNSPNDEPDGFVEVGDSTGVVVHNHNHAWDSAMPSTCACGAWIDMSDPDHPNGIVREPGYESAP